MGSVGGGRFIPFAIGHDIWTLHRPLYELCYQPIEVGLHMQLVKDIQRAFLADK